MHSGADDVIANGSHGSTKLIPLCHAHFLIHIYISSLSSHYFDLLSGDCGKEHTPEDSFLYTSCGQPSVFQVIVSIDMDMLFFSFEDILDEICIIFIKN